MSQPTPSPSRRDFLATLGASALSTALPVRSADASGAMPADPSRQLDPSKADLGTLWPEVQKLADANRCADSFLTGKYGNWAEFQSVARTRLLDLLLYRPDPVDPRPEVLERVDCGDYVRERITFSTTPLMRVPAYVLVPKNLTRPAPAIVDLHSHGGMFIFGKEKVVDLGQNHPAMVEYHAKNYESRPTATALVRRGYVVISIDAFMFGERRVLLDADQAAGWDRSRYSLATVTELNQRCRAKESTLVKGLTLAGATWPGIVFWDDMRTVDYLVSRSDVDPTRIGCEGVSMGGYRALFLAALDPRIRAGCVAGFMSTVRPMVRAHLDTHSWVHFLPAIHRFLDWPDVASLTAPRALMVLQCARDGLFPLAGMQEAIEHIAAGYERAGVREKFSGRFYDQPHTFNRQMQDDAFAWLDRHLAPPG